MDKFSLGYPEVPFSITNKTVSKNNAEDISGPFSLLEFIKRVASIVESNNITSYYNYYLTKWNSYNNNKAASNEEQIIDTYRNFLKDISLNFTSEAEKQFLSQINYSDKYDLDVALSFIARKIKEIALYYSKKREDIKLQVYRNKFSGSTKGLAITIKEKIIDVLTNALNKKQGYDIDAISKQINVKVDELYSDETRIFNKTPNERDYEAKDLDYGLDIFLRDNQDLVKQVFSTTSTTFQNLNEVDSIFDKKRDLTKKYIGSDYYYVSATQIPDQTFNLIYKSNYNITYNKEKISAPNISLPQIPCKCFTVVNYLSVGEGRVPWSEAILLSAQNQFQYIDCETREVKTVKLPFDEEQYITLQKAVNNVFTKYYNAYPKLRFPYATGETFSLYYFQEYSRLLRKTYQDILKYEQITYANIQLKLKGERLDPYPSEWTTSYIDALSTRQPGPYKRESFEVDFYNANSKLFDFKRLVVGDGRPSFIGCAYNGVISGANFPQTIKISDTDCKSSTDCAGPPRETPEPFVPQSTGRTTEKKSTTAAPTLSSPLQYKSIGGGGGMRQPKKGDKCCAFELYFPRAIIQGDAGFGEDCVKEGDIPPLKLTGNINYRFIDGKPCMNTRNDIYLEAWNGENGAKGNGGDVLLETVIKQFGGGGEGRGVGGAVSNSYKLDLEGKGAMLADIKSCPGIETPGSIRGVIRTDVYSLSTQQLIDTCKQEFEIKLEKPLGKCCPPEEAPTTPGFPDDTTPPGGGGEEPTTTPSSESGNGDSGGAGADGDCPPCDEDATKDGNGEGGPTKPPGPTTSCDPCPEGSKRYGEKGKAGGSEATNNQSGNNDTEGETQEEQNTTEATGTTGL